MSFTVDIGTCSDDPRVLIKNYSSVFSCIGSLREGVSMITPSVNIDISQFISDIADYNAVTAKLFTCNYCYIPNFKRYYYIKDITLLRSYIYTLTLEIDVLMTYNSELLECDAYVERTYSNSYSICDPNYPVNSIFTYSRWTGSAVTAKNNKNAYIIVTAVNSQIDPIYSTINDNTGILSLNALPYRKTTIDWIFSASDETELNNLTTLINQLTVGYEAINSSILSIKVFPYNEIIAGMQKVSHECYIGATDMGFKANYLIPVGTESYKTVSISFGHYSDALANDFRIFEPISYYKLYLPYIGVVGVSADTLIHYGSYNSKTVTIPLRYVIDIQNCKINYYLCGYVDNSINTILNSWSANFGISIPITTDGSIVATLQEQLTMNHLWENTVSSILQPVKSWGNALTTDSISGMMGAGVSAMVDSVQSVSSMIFGALNTSLELELIMPQGSATGGDLSALSNELVYPETIYTFTLLHANVNEAGTFREMQGVLVNEIKRLGDCSRFTKCRNVKLDNVNATITEKTIIKTMLNNGIYI